MSNLTAPTQFLQVGEQRYAIAALDRVPVCRCFFCSTSRERSTTGILLLRIRWPSARK